jgi:trans-aconitate 2-methyltransferase
MTEAMNTGPREWDAETYDRVSDPQFSWGIEVLERLELEGDETVLDAGVGSGRVAERLLERLPEGRLIAVDGSESMIEKAKERLGDERVGYAVMDLAELDVAEPVDIVFSTATFHWLPDHANLFRRIHAALKPGGRLHAQCGGAGNVAEHARVIATVASRPEFAEHYEQMSMMWNFSSAEDAAGRLRDAGFEQVETWLELKPLTPPQPREFMRTVTLVPHLQLLPESKRESFLDQIMAETEEPATLEYVRLNLQARRP